MKIVIRNTQSGGSRTSNTEVETIMLVSVLITHCLIQDRACLKVQLFHVNKGILTEKQEFKIIPVLIQNLRTKNIAYISPCSSQYSMRTCNVLSRKLETCFAIWVASIWRAK